MQKNIAILSRNIRYNVVNTMNVIAKTLLHCQKRLKINAAKFLNVSKR